MIRRMLLSIALLISFTLSAQAHIASCYDDYRTASGEKFSVHAMTAAHRTWPFGTRVKVTNQRNGRTIIVRINDRGPFKAGREIDLTYGGCRKLGFDGLAHVTLRRE